MLDSRVLEEMRRPIGEATCMPGIAYRDPDILKQELSRVFGRNWISIGFGQQVKSPGDILSVSVAGSPLILLRSLDGHVRVFHNVCRHRGLQLVGDSHRGHVKLITCPYHSWTYRLDGSCLAAPYWYRKDRKSFRPKAEEDFGLIEVRTKVWMDIVFVDLSGTAPPFETAIEPLDKRWNASAIPPLWLVTIWEADIPANWKLVVENFLDYYHLSFVHSQLGSIEASIPHEVFKLSNDLIGVRTVDAALNKPRSGPIPIISQLKDVLGDDDETYRR
jgi:phenylpropionate dioxygenase-like ring-hydroxylating dioxygenase large terminal subunit